MHKEHGARTVAGGDVAVEQFRFIEYRPASPTEGDFITCERLATGDPTRVALPHAFRWSPWHGQTVQLAVPVHYNYQSEASPYRVVTSPAYPLETETQWVVPTYHTTAIIFAARVGAGATGVPSTEWLDINVDGRSWAFVPRSEEGVPAVA
jgi:hypothetical protein